MERINEPLLGGSDPKRQHPLFNSLILGMAMFFILTLDVESPYLISKVASFFLNFISIAAILLSALIITNLREKVSILIAICIFFVVFIINVNIQAISVISFIIQPFGYQLLLISAGTYIMTISDRSNIGRNFGLFFGTTSFLNGIFNFSTSNLNYVYQFIYIIFMVLAVFLILILKNPCCEQNENITIAGKDFQSFFNALVYPISVFTDKEFLFLIPGFLFLGFISVTFPFGLIYSNPGFFELTINFIGLLYFLGSFISIMAGILFDRFEKRYLLFGIGGIGLLAGALNIGYVHTTCCSQGQENLAYAALLLNEITQSGFNVFIFALAGLLYLDCRSLSVNVCIQLIQFAGFFIIYIIYNFINFTASFYIYFLIFIAACGGIFKFLTSNDKEIV
ncbi:hypothetical protein ACTA71_007918 [Dictyostelium dimigraforme]